MPAPLPCLLFIVGALQLLWAAEGCTGKIDLVFCVDASGSVDGGEWTQQTDFVKGFIDDFTGKGAGMSEMRSDCSHGIRIQEHRQYRTEQQVPVCNGQH